MEYNVDMETIQWVSIYTVVSNSSAEIARVGLTITVSGTPGGK